VAENYSGDELDALLEYISYIKGVAMELRSAAPFYAVHIRRHIYARIQDVLLNGLSKPLCRATHHKKGTLREALIALRR
jgi:hypothetical protein